MVELGMGMRGFALILAVVWMFASAALVQAKGRTGPIVLDVEQGDSAFALRPDTMQAWWLKEDCRAAIPLDTNLSTQADLISVKQTDVVTLGDRKIRLSQQFRFDIEADTVTVSVYSSVRGGWAVVPTKRDHACDVDACRARTELPEC